MNRLSKKILAILTVACLLVPCIPESTKILAAEPVADKIEKIERKLDLETVPEVIGRELATERKHLERRYDKEESLYNVVFENADGTETLYLFDYPVKYETESGEVKDIKLDIKQDAKKTGTFVAADHKVQTTFSKKLTDGIKLKDEEVSVTLQPKMPTLSTKVSEEIFTAKLLDDKTVAYRYDDKTSLEYSLTYTGFKEDIVVSEYTGQTEYEFTLLTEGLKLEQNDGSYYLTDESGEIKATLGDIIIFTADERNNAFGRLTHETIRENEEYKLTIHVDADYLRDEATVYPIRIDPTIEINYDNNGTGGIQDVTINSTAGSSGTSGSLFVGKRANYGISRTLMKFPELDLSVIPSADNITSATVELRDIMCEAAAMSVYCHIFTGNTWNESTANWSNVNPSSYVATAMTSATVSYSNGVNMTTKHRYSFNITQAIKGWKSGTYSQDKGIIFAANPSLESGSTNISKTFASYNRSSNKPSLTVNYNNITDGKYCINNLYYGKHLKNDLSVVSGTYGVKIVEGVEKEPGLGATMLWDIQKVSGGYVIQASAGTVKYLAVSMDPSSNVVTTYNSSAIHPSCLWTISDAGNGGYYFKSVMNSRYLYYDGTTLSTVSSVGTVGSVTQKSCSWRLASKNSLQNFELYGDFIKMSDWDFIMGYTEFISQFQKIVPKGTLWADVSDFTYTGYDGTVISVNPTTGVITPKSAKPTNVTITHKPTGYQWEVQVKVWDSLTYLGVLSTWRNNESNRVACWPASVKVYQGNVAGGSLSSDVIQACSTAMSQWSLELGVLITRVSTEDAADIVIYGGTREEFIGQNKPPKNEFAGATTESRLGNPVGYYLYNNSAKILYESEGATTHIYHENGMSLDDYKKVYIHELGHALGYLGHSPVETDVMYYEPTTYTLSEGEIAYLEQFYD